ncbi:hypothetical protein PR048_015289 [Dryococelus australis]|uniref:Uncharacterized protein n=1 Tax=Dryococelus australis TaxID=614101 RepID=A0ABQ9HH18_9NEOP|nr:hypothetical protein PR048_015289 [Dryococelus australis]
MAAWSHLRWANMVGGRSRGELSGEHCGRRCGINTAAWPLVGKQNWKLRLLASVHQTRHGEARTSSIHSRLGDLIPCGPTEQLNDELSLWQQQPKNKCPLLDANDARDKTQPPTLVGNATFPEVTSTPTSSITLISRINNFRKKEFPLSTSLRYRLRFPAGLLAYNRAWESYRTMPLFGGFSRGSPVSPRPFIPELLRTHLASPSLALNSRRYVTRNSSTFGNTVTVSVVESGVDSRTKTPACTMRIKISTNIKIYWCWCHKQVYICLGKCDLAVSIAGNNRKSADVVESSFTGVEPRSSSPSHHGQHISGWCSANSSSAGRNSEGEWRTRTSPESAASSTPLAELALRTPDTASSLVRSRKPRSAPLLGRPSFRAHRTAYRERERKVRNATDHEQEQQQHQQKQQGLVGRGPAAAASPCLPLWLWGGVVAGLADEVLPPRRRHPLPGPDLSPHSLAPDICKHTTQTHVLTNYTLARSTAPRSSLVSDRSTFSFSLLHSGHWFLLHVFMSSILVQSFKQTMPVHARNACLRNACVMMRCGQQGPPIYPHETCVDLALRCALCRLVLITKACLSAVVPPGGPQGWVISHALQSPPLYVVVSRGSQCCWLIVRCSLVLHALPLPRLPRQRANLPSLHSTNLPHHRLHARPPYSKSQHRHIAFIFASICILILVMRVTFIHLNYEFLQYKIIENVWVLSRFVSQGVWERGLIHSSLRGAQLTACSPSPMVQGRTNSTRSAIDVTT